VLSHNYFEFYNPGPFIFLFNNLLLYIIPHTICALLLFTVCWIKIDFYFSNWFFIVSETMFHLFFDIS